MEGQSKLKALLSAIEKIAWYSSPTATDGINYSLIDQIFMEPNKEFYNYLELKEGRRNKAYMDTRGIWTIGVGHKILPTESYLHDKILTTQEINDLLHKDVVSHWQPIQRALRVPISQNMCNLLTGLAFHVGAGAVAGSTLVRKINEGARMDIIEIHFKAWCKWTNPKTGAKETYPPFVRRRNDEWQKWMK